MDVTQHQMQRLHQLLIGRIITTGYLTLCASKPITNSTITLQPVNLLKNLNPLLCRKRVYSLWQRTCL